MREVALDVDKWVHGQCYPAALALHNATGWAIGGLTAIRSFSRGAQMAHAWVIDPQGQAWDAGGRLDMAEMHEFFLGREKQHTRDSARYETYPDAEVFMRRQVELAGDEAPLCLRFFADLEQDAKRLVEEILLPRYPEFREAAQHLTPGHLTDPFWMPADPEREIEPEF